MATGAPAARVFQDFPRTKNLKYQTQNWDQFSSADQEGRRGRFKTMTPKTNSAVTKMNGTANKFATCQENFGIAEIHFQKKNAGFVGKAQFFMMEAVVGQARDEDRPTTGLSLEFDDNVPPDGRRKRTAVKRFGIPWFASSIFMEAEAENVSLKRVLHGPGRQLARGNVRSVCSLGNVADWLETPIFRTPSSSCDGAGGVSL